MLCVNVDIYYKVIGHCYIMYLFIILYIYIYSNGHGTAVMEFLYNYPHRKKVSDNQHILLGKWFLNQYLHYTYIYNT